MKQDSGTYPRAKQLGVAPLAWRLLQSRHCHQGWFCSHRKRARTTEMATSKTAPFWGLQGLLREACTFQGGQKIARHPRRYATARKHGQGGFTLVELLIALVIIMTIA